MKRCGALERAWSPAQLPLDAPLTKCASYEGLTYGPILCVMQSEIVVTFSDIS
jgi:hypothetical protein